MVNADPARSSRHVEQRIQDRPIGDRVAPVFHLFRFTIRRGYRSAIKMIPADHQRGLDFLPRDKVVENLPHRRPLPVAEPADPGGKSLELHPLLRLRDPAAEGFIVRERLQHRSISPENVLRIAGERCPAKRSFPVAEERTDVCRNESGDVEGILHPSRLRLAADVVSVIERHCPAAHEAEHGADVVGD